VGESEVADDAEAEVVVEDVGLVAAERIDSPGPYFSFSACWKFGGLVATQTRFWDDLVSLHSSGSDDSPSRQRIPQLYLIVPWS
jgi:hypothetical protein